MLLQTKIPSWIRRQCVKFESSLMVVVVLGYARGKLLNKITVEQSDY